MQLVIVESPAKAKTIEKYLGKGYQVIASKGHVVDLPKSELGVDLEKNFKPKYIVSKEKALQDIKKAYVGKTGLILAVDPDREGEAIGWHIARELKLITEKGKLKKADTKLSRIVFTEITKEAVQAALANPRKIDINLVDAQQARRVLDRIVGYKLSPLLWKKIRYGLSAGRVQSVALKLIVDREAERNIFKPDEYWDLKVDAQTKKSNSKPVIKIQNASDDKIEIVPVINPDIIQLELVKYKNKKLLVKDKKQAERIISEISQQNLIVSDKTSKKVLRYPKPPFTTSTLQQTASGKIGLSAKETMRIAQKLYEAGFITYMRTDSVHMADKAVIEIRKYIQEKVGGQYLPSQKKFYATKSKLAQEAHEAIRPTSAYMNSSTLTLTGKEKQLYDLIWSRAVACQMKEAELETSVLVVSAGDYQLQVNGQRILFPGFLKIYNMQVSEFQLPDISVGSLLYATQFLALQKFTQPPARYSEASLIKALEAFGIGRPSTYASIISTIIVRKYVEKINKYLIPTDIGIIVIKLLTKYFKEIVDTGFTASVEDELDAIATGKLSYVEVLNKYYQPLIKQLERSEQEIKKEDFTILGTSKIKCPDCKGKMNIKLGRFGKFLSCAKFPECKGMLSMEGKSEADIAKESETPAFQKLYKKAPLTDDKRNYVLKRGRFGQFWAHPDYPKVKDAQPLKLLLSIQKQIYGEIPKAKDGSEMILRRGRFGEFWAHAKYPEVKEVIRVNVKEVKAKKLELGVA
ncbi:MAG: type I DNA topoisomerase [bacterium]